MGFKPGAEWTGNRKGAPKKQYRRDDFTEQVFEARKADIEIVTDNLFASAKNGEVWAIKLVCQYSFTMPKSRDEAETEVHAKIVGSLSGMSKEKLLQVQKILVEEAKGE